MRRAALSPLGALGAIGFALAPLGVLVWAIATTSGTGFA
jgi:hypothetical protein